MFLEGVMVQTKALYNLLRLNAAEDPSVRAEPWALEDLRKVSLEDLLGRLNKAKIALDKKTFLAFAEQCDTPEELVDLLLDEETDPQMQDALYLVLFELWRRFLPEKPSLSIFCDELDHQIFLYEQNLLESDEMIQDGLANLQEILDEYADVGTDPQEAFQLIAEYFAHDLESFLYDYITDLLDAGTTVYASELIDGFASSVQEPIWFTFLKARLLSFTDIHETNRLIHQILDQNDDLSLLLEVLHFLTQNGEQSLFARTVKKILPHLKEQEELLEVLEAMADYYSRLDQDRMERTVQGWIDQKKVASGQLQPTDEVFKSLQSLWVESR